MSSTASRSPRLIFRNYFTNVPTELVEAARIDGAGLIQTFFQIMLPLSLPAFVVVGIFQFTNIWNDFLFGVTVVFRPGGPAGDGGAEQPQRHQLGRLDGGHGGGGALRAADGAGLHLPRPLLHPGPACRLDEGLGIRTDPMTRAQHADVVIVGSGMGGGTLAWALRDSGARVLLIERGDFLPSEPENWSAEAVFVENRYKAKEKWRDARGGWFSPGVHYFVGGNTKVYGAALPRLRQEDFGEIQHAGGISPAWPISYDDLAPYYDRAEHLYRVHGEAGADPTDPPRSGPFPFPPMPADPYMEELAERFREQGLHPAPLPVGLDFARAGVHSLQNVRRLSLPGAGEGGRRRLRRAPRARLARRRALDRQHSSPGSRPMRPEGERPGSRSSATANGFRSRRISSSSPCGAVNSAALLLRSATNRHPDGLANSSGLVGRNYMVHNNSVLVAIDPRRPNPTVFQKTISVNDFYRAGIDPEFPFPMGNLQPVGKLQGAMMRGAAPHAPAGRCVPRRSAASTGG